MKLGTDAHAHRSRRVLKAFLGIMSGSALAQLMAFAALPVLSRLYTPADTAHYTLLLGVGAVLASFAGLRLDQAVAIPDEPDESRRIFWLAVLAPLAVLPLAGVAAAVLNLAGVWTAESLDWLDYLAITLFVFVLCVSTAAVQLAIRFQSYGLLSRLPVIQMSGTLLAQVGLGIAGVSRGLFVGGLIGRSLGIASLVRSCDVRTKQAPGRSAAKRLLKEYWRFPVVFAPSSLVNALGVNVAALMLPSLFGFGPAGLFAMAARISGVPATVVSQSAGQVFLGEFARASSRRGSLRVFFRWSAALLSIAIAVASAIWVLAPVALPRLLGDEWAGTAQLAQYSGVMAGAAIFGAPFHYVWVVRQRGLMMFAWNVFRLAVTATTIWTGAQAGLPLSQVVARLAWATTVVYVVSWLGCLWAAARPTAGTRVRHGAEQQIANGQAPAF